MLAVFIISAQWQAHVTCKPFRFTKIFLLTVGNQWMQKLLKGKHVKFSKNILFNQQYWLQHCIWIEQQISDILASWERARWGNHLLYDMTWHGTELDNIDICFRGCSNITYVALSNPDCMKLQQWILPFHMDWRTTMLANGFLTIFRECWHTHYSWKIF